MTHPTYILKVKPVFRFIAKVVMALLCPFGTARSLDFTRNELIFQFWEISPFNGIVQRPLGLYLRRIALAISRLHCPPSFRAPIFSPILQGDLTVVFIIFSVAASLNLFSLGCFTIGSSPSLNGFLIILIILPLLFTGTGLAPRGKSVFSAAGFMKLTMGLVLIAFCALFRHCSSLLYVIYLYFKKAGGTGIRFSGATLAFPNRLYHNAWSCQ